MLKPTGSPSPTDPSGVDPLGISVAWADLGRRGVILATGEDALPFVDKFTTASLATLADQQGTEGFFADARGWVIALATLLRTTDGLWIDCDAEVAATLRDHLEHYHIRERVAFHDASADYACGAIAGPHARAWLEQRLGSAAPAGPCDHARRRLGDVDVMLVRIDWFGPEAFLVQSAASAGPALRSWLAAEGLATAHAGDVEALRIEGRYPAARDIPPKTLPQELGRTAQAISFTKGCYLGQETVARIDALGHVNRALALVAIDGPPPLPAAELTCDGEPAGTITSSCAAPRLGGAACLAIVHRRGLAAGVHLRVLDRTARIVGAAPHAAENQEGPR